MATEQLAALKHEQYDREIRLTTDTATWLAESLNGSMRTAFEFRSNGYELYGEDGGALGDIFHDAVEEAQVIAGRNPGLMFELRRRLIEAGEYEDMLAMTRDELPNTMVVLSDFPPELMDAGEDIGGYNAGRKQTMMRVISRQPDGSVRMVTQSLDSSDRRALEAIYARFGIRPHEGELLEQRIYTDLNSLEQENLPDHLMKTYDAALSEMYGGSWHAGIRQEEGRERIDTYQFACSQQDLIGLFVDAKLRDPAGAEKLRFKLAATASERYKKAIQRNGVYAVKTLARETYGEDQRQYAMQQLLYEMDSAGQRAAEQGMTFSGCGASISAEAERSATENGLRESGYGNQAEDKFGSLSFKCPNKICGYVNHRVRNQLLERCKKCNCDVRCG